MTTTTKNQNTTIAKKRDFSYSDDLPTLNKKMSRQIAFKTRLLEINEAIKKGKTPEEIGLSDFETGILEDARSIDLTEIQGNPVRLFSTALIERVEKKILRIKARRDELKAKETSKNQ